MMKVTEEAANHLKGIVDKNNGQVPVLGLRGGGCAGFSYVWKMKEEADLDAKEDIVIEMTNGYKMAIDSSSIMFLVGTTLELKQDLMGTMLEVVNPSASSSCGCGESINFDMEKVEANSLAFELPRIA
jgi:iron-sulfur cluster assembly accessory protein|tara:strand:+ start:98 stop:481 length:384 start_codon:yes stop_codon:yes gene_type:complete